MANLIIPYLLNVLNFIFFRLIILPNFIFLFDNLLLISQILNLSLLIHFNVSLLIHFTIFLEVHLFLIFLIGVHLLPLFFKN